jgi:hypothetical protein
VQSVLCACANFYFFFFFSDVDLDTQGLSYNTNSGSSSNSSLSTRYGSGFDVSVRFGETSGRSVVINLYSVVIDLLVVIGVIPFV